MVRPIDKTKKSSRRCANCAHFPHRIENVNRSAFRHEAEAICPTANNKPINYWNCCKQFQWDESKTYLQNMPEGEPITK